MSAASPISVDVTVVSSNQALITDCLESLFSVAGEELAADRYRLSVHAVWNGPARGGSSLPATLPERFPLVHWIESRTSGFPPNQNVMLRESRADYALVINDDLIFLPGSLAPPLEFMEVPANRSAGILGVKLLNVDGTLQPSTFAFPGVRRALFSLSGLREMVPLDPRLFPLARLLRKGKGRSRYWPHDTTCDVDTFRGAYMLVRFEALRQAGLLDTRGGEETEWIYRFHKAGWRVVFYADAAVIHLQGQTAGKDPHYLAIVTLTTYLNLFLKHYARWRFVSFCLLCAALYGVSGRLSSLRRDAARARICRDAAQLAWSWLTRRPSLD